MACPNEHRHDHNDCDDNEIVVCNTLFNYALNDTGDGTYELTCTPCCTPTAYYDVARITTRENNCSGLNYYQAFINTDPVEIIQDCNLENIVRRCIESYFNNFDCPTCNTRTRCGGNSLFGL